MTNDEMDQFMAIIDIADDGTLAGVELIDRMPPPPNTGKGEGV